MGFNLRTGLTSASKEEFKDDMNKLSPDKDSSGKYNFNHKVVCITGTIPGLTRMEAQSLLKTKFPYINIYDTVHRGTDFLITGFGVGQRKLTAANSYNITTIDATTLFKGSKLI